jgi:zinc and cadmium transporter
MTTLTWIIAATLAGGLLSALIASVVLLFDDATRQRLIPHFISFATGALLGAAFLALLPHAVAGAGVDNIHRLGGAVLGGLLVFFMLEKLVIWRHCHHDQCEAHEPHASDPQDIDPVQTGRDRASGTLILIGDGIHNAVDGVLIAAAFLTDVHLGLMTAVAVVAHEIPQEVGDFAILLRAGYTRKRAFFVNLLVGLTTVVGGVAAWVWLEAVRSLLPYVLAVAASSFIYVAVADLIPGMHQRTQARESIAQAVLIVAGVFVIFLTHEWAH